MLATLGRMCLSLIFILAAGHKILHWDETQQGIINALSDAMGHLREMGMTQKMIEYRLFSWTSLAAIGAVALELIGGLFIFFGVRARLGAFVLLIFLIPTTLLFHPFWWVEGADRELQMGMFLKNISICGGLLLLLAYGTGGKATKKASKASDASK